VIFCKRKVFSGQRFFDGNADILRSERLLDDAGDPARQQLIDEILMKKPWTVFDFYRGPRS